MQKNAKDTIGYFPYAASGCYWYRIEHPMLALKNAGFKVVEIPLNADIDDSLIDSLMSVQVYGAASISFAKVLQYLKSKGVKIIYDMDDALDLVEITNPLYYSVKKDVGSVKEMLEYADEVTVSTPELAKYARTLTDVPITIVPNCYFPHEWETKPVKHEDIRVGFSGASPHVTDLIDIIPVIKKLQEKYGIKFYIQGLGQASYEEWLKQYRYIAQPEATTELRKLDELLKEISFEWIPFVHYSQFPETLTNLSLDIGICPLRDTEFNRHRSACKAMEYTLSGALALASNCVPYREDKDSVLIDDWYNALEFFINDEQARHDIKGQHMSWIMNNRNIEDKIDLLKSVYVV